MAAAIAFTPKSQRASRRSRAAREQQQRHASQQTAATDSGSPLERFSALLESIADEHVEASDERNSNAYDELTLEVEKAEVLVAYIAERLTLLSQREERGSELFALSLIARQTCDEQFERISDKCRAMLVPQAESAVGGAR